MNKARQISTFLIGLMLTLSMFTGTTFAIGESVTGAGAAQDGIAIAPCSNTDAFNKLCSVSAGSFGNIIGTAIRLAFVIAIIIALFFLIWGGIKWILSGGEKGKVEAARGAIIAAIVGLVVTFLSYFILQVVLGIFGLSLDSLAIPCLFGAGQC